MKNPGTQYYMRDLYGSKFGPDSTATDATPEPAEQAVLYADTQAVQSSSVNKTGILGWLGILIVFVVLFNWKG